MPAPISPPRHAFFRQVRLRTLFLITAAVAVWIGYVVNQREIARLQQQIQAVRPLARELRVDDPEQVAVVKAVERWYDENIWEVYLPRPVRVCLATRDVDQQGLAPVAKEAMLPAGRHRLELRTERAADEGWRTVVTADDVELLQYEEPAAWNLGRGSTGGGEFAAGTQLPADQPVTLFRRRFVVENLRGSIGSKTYSTPDGPANGQLLWLEPVAE